MERTHTRGFALEKRRRDKVAKRRGKKLVNRETVLRIWVSGPLLKLWRILKARPLRWDNDAQRQIHVKVGATNRFNSSVCTHHCGGTGLPRLCFSTILENCEAETGRGNEREEERDLELRKKKSPLVGIFAPYCAILVEESMMNFIVAIFSILVHFIMYEY